MVAALKVVSDRNSENMDKQKALDAALAQIDRAFGKGSAMRLGSREAVQIETISTGSLGLDIALGVGGLPRGRGAEIYGPESTGQEERKSGGEGKRVSGRGETGGRRIGIKKKEAERREE